jgi:fumarate reductase subunit C
MSMGQGPTTERRYKRPMSRIWWLRNPRYTLFILREATAVFMGVYVLIYLLQFLRLSEGQASYNAYLDLMDSPGWIAVHIVVLAFALLHTVTWINLMPKGLPEYVMGIKVPALGLLVGGFGAWVVASVVVALVLL